VRVHSRKKRMESGRTGAKTIKKLDPLVCTAKNEDSLEKGKSPYCDDRGRLEKEEPVQKSY